MFHVRIPLMGSGVIYPKQVWGGFILITLLMVAIGAYVYDIPQQQMRQGQWVTHSHEVLGQLEKLSGDLNQAKTDHATYMQTYAMSYYDRYKATRERVSQLLSEIERLTKDNENQQNRLKPLRQAINSYFDGFMNDMSSQNTTSQLPPTDASQMAAQTLLERIETIRNEEERLLKERMEQWHGSMWSTRIFFLVGIAMLYAAIIVTFIGMRREALLREQLLALEIDASSMHRGLANRLSQVIEVQQGILSQRLNLQSAMDVIIQRTQHITQANGAVIGMLEGEDVCYRAVSGTMAPFLNFKIKAKGSLSGLCVESAVALRCDDSEIDGRVDKEACRNMGLRAMIVVPLIVENETVGVLKVASGKPHAFTAQDVGTLQLMAGLLVATMRDATEAEALHYLHKKLQPHKAQMESGHAELKIRADTDALTGLKNHDYFEERVTEEFQRSKRYNNKLSVLLIDLDHFKQYNDQFGQPAGDGVLRQVAVLLKQSARPSDCVARHGGEEFVLMLPQTDAKGGKVIAERIRKAMHHTTWQGRAVTVSIGISEMEETTASAADMIAQADKALYRSKANGRDRVTVYGA